MTTLAERARAEAEAAEAEEQEEQPDQENPSNDDDEQAPPVEPHPGEGLEEPTEAMIAELQAACDEHHDHVHAIMGPFVSEFVPCETCNGIGLAYPTPAAQTLEHAQAATTCSVCKGFGELLTGSNRPGYEKIQCTNCSGHGWVGQGNMPPQTVTQQAVESFPNQPDAALPQQPPAPSTTDPRVAELEATGRYIILEKPGG